MPFDPATLDLLSAYLDNELAADERAQVEASLQRDPELAALLEQWKNQGRELAELPRYRLPTNFNLRVLAALPESRLNLPGSVSPGQRESAGGALAMIAALAALVIVTLLVGFNLDQGTPNTAAVDSENPSADPGVPAQPTDRPEITSPALAMTLKEPDSAPPVPAVLNSWVDEVVSLQVAAGKPEETRQQVSQALARSGIRVNELELQPENSFLRAPAWYITATPTQFKAALKQAGSQLDGIVDAISLAQVVGAGDSESSNSKPLQSVRLYAEDSVDVDPAEVDSLDAWFGLAEPDQRKRYLLIVVEK